MTQKYIVRKIKRFSGLGNFFWLLYQYNPETDAYCFVGRYTTLGQLLCAIGCDEIDNWQFLRQQSSPGGHVTVTCYNYTKTFGSYNVEIGLDVIEKSGTRWSSNEAEGQITCNLSPEELHKILFLLHNKKAELQIELENPENTTDVGSLISMVDQVAFLDRLSGKLNRGMRQWFEDHPDDVDALRQKNDLTGSK